MNNGLMLMMDNAMGDCSQKAKWKTMVSGVKNPVQNDKIHNLLRILISYGMPVVRSADTGKFMLLLFYTVNHYKMMMMMMRLATRQ